MALNQYFIKIIDRSWKSNYIFKFNEDKIFLKKNKKYNFLVSNDIEDNI